MSGINLNFDVVNQKGTPAFYSDIFANRPTYGYPGRVFISTDTGAIYEDTGTAWTLIADAGAGTTGTLEQVTTNGNTTTQGIVISAGNLAIGTATAGAPLDVHTATGTAAQFNGTGVNNAFVFFQNAGTSKWRVGNLYNAGANSFQIYDNASATARLTILNSGATTLNGALTSTSVAITGGTSAQFLKADGSVDSNTYFTTNTNQTIGPTVTKTFNGETRFGLGTSYDNSTGVSLTAGFTTVNAGLTGSNTFIQVSRSNAYNFNIKCDLTSSGSSFVLPSGQTNALIATATGTSSQLIAGDGTLISAGTNITISAGTISASGGGGGMAIGGSITSATAGSVLYAGASGVLAQSNSNFYYDYTNNRLGLGTTSPTEKLQVNGVGKFWDGTQGLNIRAFTSGAGFGAIYTSSVTASALNHSFAASSTATILNVPSGGVIDMEIATTSALQIFSTRNISIGNTTDAGYKLDVTGTFRTSSTSYLATSGASVGIGSTTIYNGGGFGNVLSFYDATAPAITLVTSTKQYQIGVASDQYRIYDATSAVNRFIIDTSGNIGIGTATIGSKIQINGNAAIGYSTSTAAPTNGLAVSGNVGIGNTNSGGTYKLDVTGTFKTSGESFFGGDIFTYVNGGLFFNASGNYTNGIFASQSSANITVRGVVINLEPFASGGVGINCGTTIGSKLQLNGNAAIGYSASTAAPTNGLAVSGTTLLGTSTDSGQGVLQVAGGITGAGVSLSGEVVSATATLSKAYYHVFTGSTGQTLTLPSPSSNNYIYVIINNTSNAVTIAAATSTNIITTTNTSVASFTLIANARTEIIADGNNKYYQIY